MITFLKERGFHIVLISSAVSPIILRAQKYLKIDEIICTKLEKIDGIYTGKIVGLPVFGNNKVIELNKYIKDKMFNYNNLYAFADHFSDIPMLSRVGNPVVVNPSKKLLKYAQTKNWNMLYLDNDESFQYFKSYIESK